MGTKHRINLKVILIFFALVVVSLFFMFPLVWIFLSSLKTRAQIMSKSPILVFTPTLENYQEIFMVEKFHLKFLHSLIIASSTTAIALFLGMLAAYGFSRFRFRGRDNIAFMILSFRMLPPIAVVIPLFLLYKYVRLIDSYPGMVIAYLTFTLPFVTWLMRGFFDEVPGEVDECAMLDGCSRWGTFWRVAVPLSKSGMVVSGVFSFIFCWNEYLISLILTRDRVQTVPVATATFLRQFEILWGPMFASCVFVIAPLLIMLFFVQKHLVKGMTFGAIR